MRKSERDRLKPIEEIKNPLYTSALNTSATNFEEILNGGVLANLFGVNAIDYPDSDDSDKMEEEYEEGEQEEEDDEIEDDEIFDKPLTGKRKHGDHTAVNPAKRKKPNNENKTVISSHGPSISIITWNIEKFGKSTDKVVLRKKSETIGRILDQLQPMIMAMQEVTNAQLLIDGDNQVGLSGLKQIDVLNSYWMDVLYPFRFQSGIKSLLAVLTNPKLKNGVLTKEKIKNLHDQLKSIENDTIEEFIILINLTVTKFSKMRSLRSIKFNDVLDDFIKLLKTENQSELAKQKFKGLNIRSKKAHFKQYFSYSIDQIKQFHEKFNKEDRKETLKDIIGMLFKEEAKFMKGSLEKFMKPYDKTYNAEEEKRFLNMLMEMEFDLDKKLLLKDKYELSSEYAMLKGPRFIAGVELDTMSDFYPVFYNKAVIHSPPELSVYDLENGEMKTLNYHEYQHTFRYGEVAQEQVDTVIKKLEKELEQLETKLEKNETSLDEVTEKLDDRLKRELSTVVQIHKNLLKRQEKLAKQNVILKNEVDAMTSRLQLKEDLVTETATHKETKKIEVRERVSSNLVEPLKINRKLVLWKFKIPVNRFYLRPETSSFPSGSRNYLKYTELYVGVVHTSPSLDIKKEIKAIMNGAKKLSEETSIPILLSGDWYMQKKMKTEFNQMKAGENSDWVLIAPDNNTNIPGLGKEGQIADHFMGKKGDIEEVNVRSLPPPAYTRGLGNEIHDEWLRHYDINVYNQWRNITVDHTPVYSLVNIIFKNIIGNLENMKITEIAGQFNKGKNFGQSEVLQEYVTKHDIGTSVIKGGKSNQQELGTNENIVMTSTIAQEVSPQLNGYPLIKLNTRELAYTQLLTGPKPTDGWSCAKGIMERNNNKVVITSDSTPEIRPSQNDNQGINMDNACIYALNITNGFGIILAAKNNNKWYASVGCNSTMTIADDKLSAMKFNQIESNGDYYAVIAINCRIINYNPDESITVLLSQLQTMGVSSKNVTIYKSFAAYENIAISIGINADGCWGEVLDQNQDPKSIWG